MIAKIRNQQVPEVNFPLIMLIVTQFLGLLTNQNNFAVDMALLVFSFFFTRKVDIKYIIISAVFVLLILARYLTGHSAVKGYFAPIHHCTKYLNTFFGISVCCLIQYMSEREKRVMMHTVCICCIVTGVFSIAYELQSPLAIRYRGLYGGEYPWIVSFDQIFAYSIFAVMLLIMYISEKRKSKKDWLYVFTAGMNLSLLVLSKLATPMFLAIMIAVIYYTYFLIKKKKLYMIILTYLSVCILLISKQILNFILRLNTGQGFVASRVNAVINALLNNGGQTTSLSNRQVKIDICISSLKRNPWVGIGFTDYNEFTVGCHQDWYDILAVSGFLGFIVIIIFLILYSRKVYRHTEAPKDKIRYVFGLIYFFTLGFFDPCLNISIIIVVFGLIPNLGVLLRRKNGKGI